MRPRRASQRADSGTVRRMIQTKTAPSVPISTTQRQPSMPKGVCGTSSQAASATAGTARNVTTWFSAKARPRMVRGTISAR